MRSQAVRLGQGVFWKTINAADPESSRMESVFGPLSEFPWGNRTTFEVRVAARLVRGVVQSGKIVYYM